MPFFMIISSSGKEKWLPFDDQRGTHEHDQKQPVALWEPGRLDSLEGMNDLPMDQIRRMQAM